MTTTNKRRGGEKERHKSKKQKKITFNWTLILTNKCYFSPPLCVCVCEQWAHARTRAPSSSTQKTKTQHAKNARQIMVIKWDKYWMIQNDTRSKRKRGELAVASTSNEQRATSNWWNGRDLHVVYNLERPPTWWMPDKQCKSLSIIFHDLAVSLCVRVVSSIGKVFHFCSYSARWPLLQNYEFETMRTEAPYT